jgi:hypothetical protein
VDLRPVRQGSALASGGRSHGDSRIHVSRCDCDSCGCQTGLYDVKLGTSGDKDGVGPDSKHPFIIRNLLIWNGHYAFDMRMPSVMIEGMRLHNTLYGYRAMTDARARVGSVYHAQLQAALISDLAERD